MVIRINPEFPLALSLFELTADRRFEIVRLVFALVLLIPVFPSRVKSSFKSIERKITAY